jgi:hypothetical protein
MALFRCETCGRLLEEPFCDKCQREVRTEVDPLADAIARTSLDLTAPGTIPPPPPPPAQVAPPPPIEAPPQPVADSATRPSIRGLDEFNALLGEGREAIIICGGPQTGKSEIAAGLIRALALDRGQAELPMLRSSSKSLFTLGATNPGEIWYQGAGKNHVFLDPSGEFFRRLSPTYRRELGISGDIPEEYFDFVRSAVAKLGGLVLVLDLTHEDDDLSAWRSQEMELGFILAALRWLRFDKSSRPQALGLTDTIASRVARLPRLDVPVLVLFSKGDRLDRYTIQVPLQFARTHLPNLHGSLLTHARRFHYDFCHTMERVGAGDRAVERPCGVLLSMEWLLDRRFRWVPRLPSAWLGGGK